MITTSKVDLKNILDEIQTSFRLAFAAPSTGNDPSCACMRAHILSLSTKERMREREREVFLKTCLTDLICL